MANTQPIPEPLNGGLVTARDPALLEPGELTQSDDAVYYPNDPAVHKVKGRTKYNSVAVVGGQTVKGLRFLEVDSGNSFLVALSEGSSTTDDLYFSIFSDETGTFGSISAITNVGTGRTLDTVHHGNRYVALIGDTSNYLLNPNATGRAHGLAPITRLPTGAETGAPAIGAGTFNAELGTGFFHFITTEVVDDGQNPPIESTFTGTPATASTALTTPTSQVYTITKPATVNSNATRWRVYMSQVPQTNPTPVPNLNAFRLVAEANISDATVTIGNVAGSSGRFPTVSIATVAGWSNPSNAFTDNGVGARNSTDGATEDYTTFGFDGTLSGTVKGIQVFVKFKIPDYTPLKRKPKLSIQISPDSGANYFGNEYTITADVAGAVAAYQLTYFGSPDNLWGKSSWATTDFNDANFRVRMNYTLANTFAGATNAILDVDYIQVRVFTTSTTPSVNVLGRPFRTVNVSVAGITSTFGADGQPPVSSTGDMFEGQLVLNDVEDQSIIRYSLPEYIESFPSIYFLNFESKVQDFVTCIRRLGNKLIVGLKQQLYRINYLPRETDAEFDRGRAYEAISETEGIVGTQAACLFSPDGGALLLAYISHSGPRYTDGFQSFSLSDDLDWAATVRLPVSGSATNYLQNAVFVNYANLSQLWLYYTPPGQTTNTKALVFHYNQAHRKSGGTYKVTGPITVVGLAATTGRIGGNEILLTGQTGGFVYVEDRAYADASGGAIAFAVKTREIYSQGVGRTGTVENLFIRHNQDATSTITVTPYTRYSNAAQTTQATKTFTTAQAGVPKLPFHHNHESIQWKFSEEAPAGSAGIRLSGLVMELAGTGLPEPRP
jgi:hypothetical protein